MYLHIGQDKIIKQEEIIGIFDLDNTTVSKVTRDYLSKKEKEKKIITVGYDLPKSFILSSDKKEGDKIYITQVSSSTLLKRINSPQMIIK